MPTGRNMAINHRRSSASHSPKIPRIPISWPMAECWSYFQRIDGNGKKGGRLCQTRGAVWPSARFLCRGWRASQVPGELLFATRSSSSAFCNWNYPERVKPVSRRSLHLLLQSSRRALLHLLSQILPNRIGGGRKLSAEWLFFLLFLAPPTQESDPNKPSFWDEGLSTWAEPVPGASQKEKSAWG